MSTLTPLKPIENRRVRAVLSDRYPLNKVCAHPTCKAAALDAHHTFPRSQIAGDSWFVEIAEDEDPTGLDPGIPSDGQRARYAVIPHVTGLCREHHEQVERHDAWIKLEEGVWNWYVEGPVPEAELDRWEAETGECSGAYPVPHWDLVGPLNPQPGSVEGKPKRERHKGIAPRKRVVFSFKVPKDEAENGHEILTSLIEAAKEDLGRSDQPTYYTLVEVLHFFLTTDHEPGSVDGHTD